MKFKLTFTYYLNNYPIFCFKLAKQIFLVENILKKILFIFYSSFRRKNADLLLFISELLFVQLLGRKLSGIDAFECAYYF